MLKKLLVLPLVVIALVTGCSATGPKFSNLEAAESNKAKVYFYRPWAMLDGAAAPIVQVNGVDKFDISNGGYELIVIEPQETKFTVKEGGVMSNWRADELTIKADLEPNKIYFVRLTAELADAAYVGGVSTISGNYSLGLIQEDVALKELRETKKN